MNRGKGSISNKHFLHVFALLWRCKRFRGEREIRILSSYV